MRALPAAELERELIALQEMKTSALQQKWREVFKTDPPRKMRAAFLQRAIAYRLQEITFGGLKPQTKRELGRLAQELRQSRQVGRPEGAGAASIPRRILSPGTRMLREWNGVTELVEVTEDGFVWKAQTYRTLSAVAVAITGTKWSGPKFFGLDNKPGRTVTLRQRHAASRTSTLEEVPA